MGACVPFAGAQYFFVVIPDLIRDPGSFFIKRLGTPFFNGVTAKIKIAKLKLQNLSGGLPMNLFALAVTLSLLAILPAFPGPSLKRRKK